MAPLNAADLDRTPERWNRPDLLREMHSQKSVRAGLGASLAPYLLETTLADTTNNGLFGSRFDSCMLVKAIHPSPPPRPAPLQACSVAWAAAAERRRHRARRRSPRRAAPPAPHAPPLRHCQLSGRCREWARSLRDDDIRKAYEHRDLHPEWQKWGATVSKTSTK